MKLNINALNLRTKLSNSHLYMIKLHGITALLFVSQYPCKRPNKHCEKSELKLVNLSKHFCGFNSLVVNVYYHLVIQNENQNKYLQFIVSKSFLPVSKLELLLVNKYYYGRILQILHSTNNK